MPKRIPPVTDRQLRMAKPAEKDYKIFDGAGLYLLVTTTGGKLWRLKYRLDGKEKTLAFGSYPEISLVDAREKRREARSLIAKVIDPREEKERLKSVAVPSGPTFEEVSREWHQKFKGEWSQVHAQTILDRLEKDVFPYLGNSSIEEMKAPDLLSVLHRIEKRGALDTAHRVRHHCKAVFTYAIATGRAERNIAQDLQGALPPARFNHYAAPTDPGDLAPLLRAIDTYQGSPVVRSALQLSPLFFLRPGELRHAEWIELDLEAAQWNISAEKMKMKLPHIVPLARQAVEILKDLHPLTGRSRYVFPCGRSYLRPMSENAVNAALRRMGFEKGEITGHGFRATARTILDEVLEFRPDFIEHQLAHLVKDPNGRAYNRTAFLPQRREMMQAWADYLDKIKKAPSSK